MTAEVFPRLNWLAVLVAGIAYFALGGLWFSKPAFGDIWSRSIGWDAEGGESPGASYYIGPFITCLIATIVAAALAVATGSDTVLEGVVLGLLLGVGIAGSALFVTGVFDPKKPEPMKWFAVTGGYHVVGLTIASVIVSLWR